LNPTRELEDVYPIAVERAEKITTILSQQRREGLSGTRGGLTRHGGRVLIAGMGVHTGSESQNTN
jgi:hypothetical protein